MVKSSSRVPDTPNGSIIGVCNDPGHNSIPPKLDSNGKKQFKGVRMRSWGSWVSEIRAPNQKTRIWLGSYSTPEAAARAYDAALLCLKGSSASLNFPTSKPLHLPTTLMSPKSIQRVAAAAAANATASSYAHPDALPPPSLPSSLPSPPPSSDVTNDDTSTTVMSSQGSMMTSLVEEWCHTEHELHDPSEPSIDFEAFFQSPKCMDYMLNPCAFFAPPQAEEWEEDGDINLWSFC